MRKIEFHLRPDPSQSDAEYYHRLNSSKPNQGQAQVAINMRELIGGYCRYKNRTPARDMAAAKFKALIEACQIANLRAVDMERPIVDTSMTPASINMEYGEQARAEYKTLFNALDRGAMTLLHRVIVEDRSQRDLVNVYNLGKGSYARAKLSKMVHGAVDDLAGYYNL